MNLHHMPHPVTSTMRVVQPLGPHRCTGQRVDLLPGRALWKPRHRHRDMTAKNGGKGGDHRRCRRADEHGAGDIGGAVMIVRARIDQQQAVLDKDAVLAGDGAVMDNGAIRPRPADGLKAGGQKARACLSQRQQMTGNFGLLQAMRRTAVKPGKEAHHCGTILDMRAAGAVKLGFILVRLHRRDRAWCGDRIDLGCGKRCMKLVRQAVGIKHHPCSVGIAGTRVDQIGKLCQRHDRSLIRQITFHDGRKTVLVTKQDQPVLAVIQREQEVDRRVRQIGAAYVHQPVHSIGAADHDGLTTRRLKPCRQRRQLVRHRLASDPVRHAKRARGRGIRAPITPERINGVVGIGNKFSPGFATDILQPFKAAHRDQPRVNPDARTIGMRRLKKAAKIALGQCKGLP